MKHHRLVIICSTVLVALVIALVVLSSNYDYAGPYYALPVKTNPAQVQSAAQYQAHITTGWGIYRTEGSGVIVYMRRSWLRGWL